MVSYLHRDFTKTTSQKQDPWIHCPDTVFFPLTELRDITLSLRSLINHPAVVKILSSITSTKIDSVTFIVWQCYYPHNGLRNFCPKWIEIDKALCRLSELREGTESGGEVVLNLHFDDEGLAEEFSEFLENRELMPLFQELGLINIEVQ